MDAVQKGDLETVKALIQSKADVNAQTDAGWTPLKVAVMEMKPEIVKALIAAGADVNAQDPKSQVSALMLAADGGMEKRGFPSLFLETGAVVKLLLDARANVNAADAKGLTALHHAVAFGDPEIVKALIAAGANLNAAQSEGLTALMLAVTCRSILCRDLETMEQLVQTLLQAKANVNALDLEGEAALHDAAFAKINIQNPERAAIVASRLLDAGADPKLKNREGKSPEAFVQAMKRVKAATVKPLDEKTAALKRAILYRDFLTAGELLKAGVDVNAQDAIGQTLLMKAIACSFEGGIQNGDGVNLAEALIAAGANVNASDQNGTTALMLASEQLFVGTVESLLKAGADAKAKDREGRTAFDRFERVQKYSRRDVYKHKKGSLIIALAKVRHEDLRESLLKAME